MTYTSEYENQLTAIVAAIKKVPEIGRVHDRPRQGDFLEMWTSKIGGIEKIRSWEISAGPERVERIEQGSRHRYRQWFIRGVEGLTDLPDDPDDPDPRANDENLDASYHVIRTLAGEITDQIEADRLSHISVGTWIDFDPVQGQEPIVIEIGGGAIAWGITLTLEGYTIVSP